MPAGRLPMIRVPVFKWQQGSERFEKAVKILYADGER